MECIEKDYVVYMVGEEYYIILVKKRREYHIIGRV
jgi:hypothetical protein